jgi:hypothetical protein
MYIYMLCVCAESIISESIISGCAQNVSLHKYFSHPSLVIALFSNPKPIKLKLALQTSGRLTINSNSAGWTQ